MSQNALAMERQRLGATLETVRREGVRLLYSQQGLACQTTDKRRVVELENNPAMAERLEAFVSRYSRMQDTIGEKLLPHWLHAQGERTTTLIDTLNRAERLQIINANYK